MNAITISLLAVPPSPAASTATSPGGYVIGAIISVIHPGISYLFTGQT